MSKIIGTGDKMITLSSDKSQARTGQDRHDAGNRLVIFVDRHIKASL